jgi:hypothetical protein
MDCLQERCCDPRREASSISDPRSALTLEAYEVSSNTKPVKRVAWETFVNYGKWFQQRSSVELDHQDVGEILRSGSHFAITLSDGNVVSC